MLYHYDGNPMRCCFDIEPAEYRCNIGCTPKLWVCRRVRLLGEHTAELLGEICGLYPDEIRHLRDDGVA